MKPIDISSAVMKKIVQLEESRTRSWVRGFYMVIGGLIVIVGFSLGISWKILGELHAWDLLEIFTQDWEIIAEFWQDTMSTFLQELPLETLMVALSVVLGIGIIFILTRRRRAIIRFKQDQLAKKRTMSKNKHT